MIVNFLDSRGKFGMEFDEAIGHFKDKGLKQTWAWDQMLGQEHDAAFTVAKMMNDDLLNVVKGALDDTLKNGKTLKQFQDELIPILQKKGWWGKQVVAPNTKFEHTVQLGSASRLETIYRTNLQSSYAAGHWQSIQANKVAMPYLMYDAVDDGATRAEHAAHDNIVRPVDDNFWDSFYPPNGWNCRCGVIQLSEEDLEDYGVEVSPPQKPKLKKFTDYKKQVHVYPEGVDPGFNHNPGKKRAEKLKDHQAKKLEKFEGALKQMVNRGNKATDLAAKQAKESLKELGIALTKGQAEIAAERFQHKIAQFEIDAAIEAKTPYLAPAINSIVKTVYGKQLDAVKLLELAKEKAAAKKVSDQLGKYKKAKIAGKTPGESSQKAFDSLPDEAQSAILAEIDFKTGNAQAKEELAKIAAGEADKQASIKKAIFTKLEKDGHDHPDAKSLLAEVEKLANEKQAAKEKAKHINGYKKKAAAGQIPTPKQKEIFDSLDELEQAKITEEINLAKAPKYTTEEVDQQLADALEGVKKLEKEANEQAPLSMDNMVKTGAQGGSNDGGFYKDTSTGKDYYIKHMDNDESARNEVLAAKLYEAAGVEVPQVRYFFENGKAHITSEIVEGLEKRPDLLKTNQVDNVHENLAVDAWLANWDVIGLTYDNMLVKNGRAIRLDTGGALRFRAQGGLKNHLFGDTVGELKTLRNPSDNYEAASVFGHATDAQILTGVKKVLRITDKQIDDLVDQLGPHNHADKQALKATLKARREHLAKLYPEAAPKAAPIIEKPKGVTKAELEEIKKSRINGHSFLVDEDLIQDHNVRINTYTSADGKTVTVATFKATEKGLGKIESKTAGKEGPDTSLHNLKERVSEAARGIGALVRDNEVFRPKDLERIKIVLEEMDDVIAKINKYGADTKDVLATLEAWKFEFQRMQSLATPGEKAQPWSFLMNSNDLPDQVDAKLKAGAVKGLAFTQKNSFKYPKFHVENSNAKALPGEFFNAKYGDNLEANPEKGVNIRVVNSQAYYNRGYTHIEVEGEGLAAIDKIHDQIDAMGIPNTRTTEAVRTELYLDQTAYHRWAYINGQDRLKHDGYKLLNDIEDPKERAIKKLKYINDEIGYDITKTKGWNDRESTQAWGHGRNVFLRSDLDSPEYEKFSNDHLLYHSIGTLSKSGPGSSNVTDTLKIIFENGGTLISLSERSRRGIDYTWQAASTDYTKGGGGYVFTRIKKRTSTRHGGLNAVGLYWKPKKHMKRMDRVSYSGDNFGSQAQSDLSYRGETPEKWTDFATNSTDETIFKDGLSLFDDLEKIVVYDESARQEMISWLKAKGYDEWPDGRTLETVIKTAT